MKVVFSKRAIYSVYTEVVDNVDVETGGFFLGKFINDICYVVETIFSGPNALHEKCYFEYEEQYVNYQIDKMIKMYGEKIEVVGVWHRHTSSKNYFSDIDNKMNNVLVKAFERNIISAIVNMDSDFRLTVYYIKENSENKKMKYSIEKNLPIDINKCKGVCKLWKKQKN